MAVIYIDNAPFYFGRGTAYDKSRDRLVVFGCASADDGNDGWDLASDTWELDVSAKTWEKKAIIGPSIRQNFVMAYHEGIGKVLLFGGWTKPDSYLDDAWSWDGTAWTSLSTGPYAVANCAFAYDPTNEVIVIFGGSYTSTIYRNTYLWDGSTFVSANGGGPSARIYSRMAYDGVNDKMLLFGGGVDYTGDSLNDTWSWNGSTSAWTQLTPATTPTKRAFHSMNWDAHAEKLYMYGGNSGMDVYNPLFDTLEWNGTNWSTFVTPTLNIQMTDPAIIVQSTNYIDSLMGTIILALLEGEIIPDVWTLTDIFKQMKCLTETDYIVIGDAISVRYGANKLINLVDFLPQYIQQTSTKQFLQVFEDFLNNMFDGDDGLTLSALSLTLNKDYAISSTPTSADPFYEINDRLFTYDLGTSSTSAVSSDANNTVSKITINLPSNYADVDHKISILEKIKRLTELQDPDLIPLEFMSMLGKNLGYQVDVTRNDMAYTGELGTLAAFADTTLSAVDINKYLRFMIANLPNWYKIKTTKNAIKVLLYSFGLIGELDEYYTYDYDKYWSAYDSVNKLNNIPDNYYATPHFSVRVNIDDSVGSISFDEQRRTKVINAVESIRPVNTVFERLNGYAIRQLPTIMIDINTRIRANFVIT